MARGEPVDALLSKVQERRLFPVRVVQAAQKAVHDKLLKPLIESKATIGKVPFVLRLFEWFPVLRRIPARLVGLGIRREHVRSPEVVKTD
jgi:hypothetical protein